MQRALPPANSIVGRFKGTILICRVNAARCASLNVGTARGGHHQQMNNLKTATSLIVLRQRCWLCESIFTVDCKNGI